MKKHSYKNQLFPIFDPISEKLLGHKTRISVHTEGSWHKAIQAHIIRKNTSGSFDILLQTRSQEVDIGKKNLDQSIAIQLRKEDELDFRKAVARGLDEELGIKCFSDFALPNANLNIVKKYKENSLILNREFLYLYLILLPESIEPKISSSKVENIFWISWEEAIKKFRNKNQPTTRTARFYFKESILTEYIEEYSKYILGLKNTFTSQNKTLREHLILNININDFSKTIIFPISEKKKNKKLFYKYNYEKLFTNNKPSLSYTDPRNP